MKTKFSVALLSGLSLFLSVGAFAVSDEDSDYINWSYAMGEDTAKATHDTPTFVPTSDDTSRDCTVGCPARPTAIAEPLTLTYEDEAAPVVERVETFAQESQSAPEPSYRPVHVAKEDISYSISRRLPAEEPEKSVSESPVNTNYVQMPPKVQYPIVRQYPISVQYPVTVQRNMTVEQPVIMQQPVIVRRPVVMQQEITVQRQPTVIQHRPVIMQQQPTYLQQQPVYIQAPAQPVNPIMLNGFGYMPQIQTPDLMPIPSQAAEQQPVAATSEVASQPVAGTQLSVQPVSATMPQMTFVAPMPPQNYQVQGQIQAQPIYAVSPYMAAQPVFQQPHVPQPMYSNYQ